MPKQKRPVDKVRASRDGHEYHEIWTARKAMQLLWPDSKLAGIAVEGLSPIDQGSAASETVDIADITIYHGGNPNFEQAARTSIVQFKYSIANKDTDFRASHAKKTIQKFGKTYQDYKKRYGAQTVKDKLDFELITNQPIYKPFVQAINALAQDSTRTGDVERQANQFKTASGLDGKPLAEFAAKCAVIGRGGDLPAKKADLASLLVDWSATTDPIASARLGQLKQMVRDKAGYAGTNQNLITRTDILAALDIGDADDLLPCKSAIPDVGDVVQREQFAHAISLIPKLSSPLLVHAAGGVGKTVFLDSLASAIDDSSEVLFFDCFGGGAYRSVDDSRHLPKNGLIHIANILAFRGLCDPILPGSAHVDALLRTFRRRLEQCVNTFSRVTPGRQLAIFIDAIDNAKIIADQRSEDSFPILLMESLHDKPISGVQLIVSCRTERKPSTYAQCQELELDPFTLEETTSYLRARLKDVSRAEVNVAQARSGGNPRVLEYLLKSDRGLLDQSEIEKKIELDDLIQERITEALLSAMSRGYEQETIDAFLAGLAVLPPPVPIDEYAGAHGIDQSAVESFASDLSPLLERTNQGLMFRDEPTETLVHNRYASSVESLRRVATNLLARQDTSVYAARALPGLLHKLDDGDQLFKLAFDDRIPASITSTVGQRNIRYSRLKAATLHAAIKQDSNRLVRLLLELSTIAAVDERGADYILDNPDLVVAARDVDSTRRLFEMRTTWPGSRHARLTIANILSGETGEAHRHAVFTSEWINHYRRRDRDDQINDARPDRKDISAIPFFLISQSSAQSAINFLEGWQDWYVYEVCENVFEFSSLAQLMNFQPTRKLGGFVSSLSGIGLITAALSFKEFPRPKKKELTIKLAKACKKATKLRLSESYQRERTYQLQDGLRKASAIALSLGLVDEAMGISLRAPHQRPNIWSFRDVFYHKDVFPFVFRTALVAAAKKTTLHEKNVLPKELVPICLRIRKDKTGKDFRDNAKKRLAACPQREKGKGQDHKEVAPVSMSYDEKSEAGKFIDHRLELLLALTKSLASFLAASPNSVDKAFIELLQAWEVARKVRDPYRTEKIDNFFHLLGFDAAILALWSRSELKPASVKRFLTTAQKQYVGAQKLIQIVSILAKRPTLNDLAGEQALEARRLIEAEDDVTQRASLFADLSRAMLPASIDEASVYFRDGLEQMDAIGSGDWEFTNELLLFASSIKGDELDESDFHTLTNICELNIGEEPEKFPWGAFARGLSRVAGPRGLAKLSRWDDRTKIPLKNTLLPYLTALVCDGKIAPEDALALNLLASPVEYFQCGTKDFALALHEKVGADRLDVISELIQQFEDDNPGVPMDSTVEALANLAKETLGPTSETTSYLTAAFKRFGKTRQTQNEHMNSSGMPDQRMRKQANDLEEQNQKKVNEIAAATNPTDEASLSAAITSLNSLQQIHDLRSSFFAALRSKVQFDARATYIRNICALAQLSYYIKFGELEECKQSWGKSSAALDEVYMSQAIPLVHLHADDLISHGTLSGYNLKKISDLTNVSTDELVIELIKSFAGPDSNVSGSIWLAFASLICHQAEEGQGQLALNRLLRGESAKLADNVVDGVWEQGLYPDDDFQAIAAGLVWRMLGSPYTKDRWRAAHSLKCFARFGRWEIIDAVVEKLNDDTAGPFQAEELPFFFLHARLWLIIALARIALDHPEEIARYKKQLLDFATGKNSSHVLMRHFAARVLLSCIDAQKLNLSSTIVKSLREADQSPHPRLKEKRRDRAGFYQGRPSSLPEPQYEFHLDYDFHKHDVDSLGRVFGRPCWEVADILAEAVNRIDPNVSGMYESSGRESRYRNTGYGISTRYHSHGQQLGWHGLLLAAGTLLRKYPVTEDYCYENDSWGEWLRQYVLTRDDGLWLSDGTDRTPLDTVEILLEKSKNKLALTGDRDKLLHLAGLSSSVGKELVVEGSWHSSDNVRIRISSVLVPPKKSAQLARKLTREEPMLVWIPIFQENEDELEYLRDEKKQYTPWIVSFSGEARLDEHDPFGVPCANCRPRIAHNFLSYCSLSSDDPFDRMWHNKRGKVVIHAQAWGREDKYSEGGPYPGERLTCSTTVLKKILTKFDKDLLLLIKLERYESGSYHRDSKYTHTVAVARITKELALDYFKGRINHVQKSQF